jgi:hypothetical protein
MTTTPDIYEVLAALRRFRKGLRPLKKSAKGESNGETFSYAPIDDILKHISKRLADQGLDIIQTVTGDIGVCTRLAHHSGQWIEDTAIISVKSLDDKGAAITRLRRYALICLLGLPTVDEQHQTKSPAQLLVEAKRQIEAETFISGVRSVLHGDSN